MTISGVISAIGCGSDIRITNIDDGDMFSSSQSPVDINWQAVCGTTTYTYNVLWTEDERCSIESDWHFIGSYGIGDQPAEWDISSLDEGDDYCVAVVAGENINGWWPEDSEESLRIQQ